MSNPDRQRLLAALNLPQDWSGRITPLAAPRLTELDLTVIQQQLAPDTRFAVFVDAESAFGPHWLPRLRAGLPENSHYDISSALTTGVYELSPVPEGVRFGNAFQQLDNLLFLHQKTSPYQSVSVISPHAIVVRVHNGRLAVHDFSCLPASRASAATTVFLQPPGLLRCQNVPKVGDQRPLPAHPMRSFHEWLQTRLPELEGDTGAMPEWPTGFPGLDGKPVMLHITMDWGGGVNKWINEYIRQERDYHHLVLASEGEFFRRRFGEALNLHWGATNGLSLRRFELGAPIRVMADDHVEYTALLESVVTAFGVERVLVSSVIGHGLACLRTGLPTMRVFHDYFPHWPLLNARLNGCPPDESAWQAAWDESRQDVFGGITADAHQQWHQALIRAYQADNVVLLAPSDSAMKNLQALGVPAAGKVIHKVPHAMPPWPDMATARKDDNEPEETTNPASALTVLLPGRVNAVKGQEVLEALLDEWEQHIPDARLILLGAGRQGRKFAHRPQVRVIEDYRNEELPAWLQKLRPHVALLLSQAAETFSYTLSEMQQAGIPVIATDIGALGERVRDGETGLLVTPGDPQKQAREVLMHLKSLRDNPDLIQKMRHNSRRLSHMNFAQAHQSYRRLWQKISGQKSARTPENRDNATDIKIRHQALPVFLWPRYGERQLAERSTHQRRTIQQLQQRLQASESLTEERTQWAWQLQKHITLLEEAIDDLKKHQVELQHTIAEREKHIAAEQAEVEHLKQVIHAEQARLGEEIRRLQSELAAVYNSTSWRITKPLRFVRRGVQNGRARLAYRLRQAAGLPVRFSRSLKTRGWRGTIDMVRQRLRADFQGEHAPGADADAVAVMETTFSPIVVKTATDTPPRVSVIIPVYNHFEHTWNCLNSIAGIKTAVPFEVIVVDDASTDETKEKMALISGVRYHRQPHNGGFIESCNTGAALAAGEYLLFLNNDTMVRDDWLDALLDIFQSHPDAGVAGSQLLYPDGRLQEAGGIVFSDASGWNYGRNQNPQAPECNHVRAVDYCSGASIMIPKALFDHLGGFDTRYKPAYYEDTDLAFAVRQAGKSVYYQPASQVVHFEGVSSGTDITSGTKRFQAINQKKFAEKWAQALARQPAPGSDIEWARIHGQPPRVLIADATTPTPDQDSGSLRMMNLIRILRELGYHVIFMPENLAHAGAYTRQLQHMGVECLYHPFVRNPMDYLRDKGTLLDAVILSRYYVAEPLLPLVRHYAPQAQVIFDTVDLHYVREARQAELADNPKLARLAEKTRLREQSCIKQADVTWVVSPYEQQLLEKALPAARVDVLSNIHEIPGCRRPFDQRRDVMFVGGFQHTPNVDAALWFVKEIWPRIRKQLPQMRFHLIGSKAPDEIRALGAEEGVVFHGFVPDLAPFLDGCRLAVAPLRFGAGVKGKVNLSMSYGQPVVATGVATEGMHTAHETDVLNAETPADFAAAVVRLYQDQALWEKLSANGLKNVEQWFSFAAARRSVQQALQKQAAGVIDQQA